MSRRMLVSLAVAACAALAVVTFGSGAALKPGDLTPVPTANTKAAGYDPPNRLSPELQELRWAQGSSKLENPEPGVVSWYGYDDDGPMVPP